MDSYVPCVGVAHKLVMEAVWPNADCNLALAADSDLEYAKSRVERASSYAGLGVPIIAAEAFVYWFTARLTASSY
jgi:hypothetical protein